MNNNWDELERGAAPSSLADDDLLRQSLTEDDDAAGFDHPWNPWSLVVMTFFFGVTAGIGLLAFNYQRLGIKGRLYSTIAVALVLEVLLTAAHVLTMQRGLIDPNNRDEMRTFRLGVRVISVLSAVVIAQTQQKRFRLFGRSDLPAGHLLKPALAAIAVSVALNLVEAGIILPAMLDR